MNLFYEIKQNIHTPMDCCQALLIDRTYQYDTTVSVIKIDGNITQFVLKIIGSSININIDIKNVIARGITQEKNGYKLTLTSVNGILQLLFQKEENAKQLYEIILQKSEVHMMNGIIDSLDKGISAVWPLPGGLFA